MVQGEPKKCGKNTDLQTTCAGKAKPFILMGTHWRPTGCYEFQLCRTKKRWLLGNVRWQIRLSPYLSKFLCFTAVNLAAVQTDKFCCLFKQWFAVSHLAFLGTAVLSSTGSCDRSSLTVALLSMRP